MSNLISDTPIPIKDEYWDSQDPRSEAVYVTLSGRYPVYTKLVYAHSWYPSGFDLRGNASQRADVCVGFLRKPHKDLSQEEWEEVWQEAVKRPEVDWGKVVRAARVAPCE